MKNIYYSLIAILCLFIILSCSENSPTGTESSGSSTTMYQLVVSAYPGEAGTVSPSSNEYEDGESVEITATSNDEWVFQNWQGGHSGSSNPASVIMDKDRQVTAFFVKIKFALKKEIEGEGNVYERVVQQKTSHHLPGTTVEVVAVPETGWLFSHWAGDLAGNENPVSIDMDSEKTIKVVFERKDYDLTIEVDGVGAVSEEVVQAKTTEYPYQTVIELTGNAGEGWRFDRWEGDLSGSNNPSQIKITESKNVRAIFVRQSYDLNINIEGGGTISESLVSGTETDGKYEYESEVKLTAEPDAASQFKNWIGDIESTDNPLTVTLTGDTEITAVFEDADYSLTIEIQGEGQVEQEIVQSKSTTYPGGTEVKLTALSEGDWSFVGWKEAASGTENVTTIFLDRDLTVIASFDNSSFEGGDGSEEYPYEVATVEQLQDVRNYTERHFIQVADIDASDTQKWNDGRGFIPIGESVLKFGGVFNGNNFTINNLYINRIGDSIMGLFGINNSESILKNINILGAEIKAGSRIGVLIGFNEGLVENSFTSGSVENLGVSGDTYVGGMIGYNQGKVIDSSADVQTKGDRGTGGLVGFNKGLILASFSEGVVNGGDYTGGLVGYNNSSSGEITMSYSVSTVEGKDYVGGLVGIHSFQSNISFSSFHGTVVGQNNVGGLVGANANSTTIVNSYSRGAVQGNEVVGGIVGVNTNSSTLINSFTTATVNGNVDVGGLVGLNGADIESSYWDTESTGQGIGVGRGSSNGTSGLTTTEMQGSAAQENMPEFDWVNIWKTTSGYPILRWQED